MSKQLYKLIDVIKVVDLSSNPMVERELALIKVSAEPAVRSEILGVVETFRAAVVDIGPTTVMVQVIGGPDKIDAMLELLTALRHSRARRTGVTAMNRGAVRSS